jgi:hypothetical protein
MGGTIIDLNVALVLLLPKALSSVSTSPRISNLPSNSLGACASQEEDLLRMGVSDILFWFFYGIFLR